MLVLSRKPGEKVLVGPNVVLTVVDIRGDRVKLAFDAPDSVGIHREEVYRQIQHDEPEVAQQHPPEQSTFYSEFA